MVQPLLETPDRRSDASPISVPPPIFFKPLQGQPSDVKVVIGPYERAVGDTAAREAGLHYEQKVQKRLIGQFNIQYWPAPYVHFKDGDSTRFNRTVVPDGLMIMPNRIFIIEIKAQHTPDAWWQLTRLYKPVIREWPSCTAISCIEICRTYDPSTPFPCKFDLLSSIDDDIEKYSGEFGVLPWRM